jgi:hypothetical protein
VEGVKMSEQGLGDERKQPTSDFKAFERRLGVRLCVKDYWEDVNDNDFVSQELTTNLTKALVFDSPKSARLITTKEIVSWNKSVEELFSIGIKNIKKNYSFEATKHDVGGDRLWVIEENHRYAANIAFDLDDNDMLLGNFGSLLSFPTKGSALVYPINDSKVLSVLVKLIDITESVCRKDPEAFCHAVYWYREGQFFDFSSSKTFTHDGEWSLSPPSELLSLLHEIGECEKRQRPSAWMDRRHINFRDFHARASALCPYTRKNRGSIFG